MLWAYSKGLDELTGALMALSLFAWEVGLAFLVLFQWRAFREKRWRVLGGFAMTLTILLATSFLIYPDWVLPFLTAAAAMARSPHGFTSASILVALTPVYGARLAQGLSILVVGLLIIEWAAGRESDFRRFLWTACLALAAMPLSGLRTDTGQLVAIAPAFAIIYAAAMGKGRVHAWLGHAILLIACVLPWAVQARWHYLGDPGSQHVIGLLYPLTGLIGLYWTRWWFLHPHDTWMDQVRRQGSG
jgi:hypothetical protein